MRRQDVIDVVRDLFRFGKVSSTSTDSQKSVQCKVAADDGEAGPSDQEMWGHAPLLYKPSDDTECLFYQLGDERVVFATKHRQFQIEVGDGEVVVRALGAQSAAYIQLKPGGDAVIKGANVTVDMSGEFKSGATATQFVALSNLVLSQLNAIKTAFDTHTHMYNPGPSALAPTVVPTVPMPAPASVAATKTKAL